MGSMSVYISLVWLFGLLGLFSSSLSVIRLHFGRFCDGGVLVVHVVAMCVCMCSVRLFGLLGLFSSTWLSMRLHFGRLCDSWVLVAWYGFYVCLYMFGVVTWASRLLSVEFVSDEIALRSVV